jgi:hypothetical protein
MRTSKVIRIVQATLIAVGLAFAISVVVAGHWWSDKPKVDLGDLGKQVTSGLQNQFDTSDGMKQYGLHVADDIMLINVTGNEYRGLVTVRTNKLKDVLVGVILYADGSHMIYHIDPESAPKLIQAAERDEDRQQTCSGPPC